MKATHRAVETHGPSGSGEKCQRQHIRVAENGSRGGGAHHEKQEEDLQSHPQRVLRIGSCEVTRTMYRFSPFDDNINCA